MHMEIPRLMLESKANQRASYIELPVIAKCLGAPSWKNGLDCYWIQLPGVFWKACICRKKHEKKSRTSIQSPSYLTHLQVESKMTVLRHLSNRKQKSTQHMRPMLTTLQSVLGIEEFGPGQERGQIPQCHRCCCIPSNRLTTYHTAALNEILNDDKYTNYYSESLWIVMPMHIIWPF